VIKIRFLLGFFGILLVWPVSTALAQDYPSPVGFVNDNAYLLSEETIDAVEAHLVNLEKETTAEVVVVTVDSLEGYTIEDYAAGLFEEWAIGKKDKDNGALFIVAYEESMVRIEVGYGLEDILTDGRVGRILDDEVVPYFREYDYEAGISAGTNAIVEYIRDGTPPSVIEENPVQDFFEKFRLPLPLVISLGILTVYIVGFMARTKSVWLGGIWGLILGLILGFGFGGFMFFVLLPLGLGIFGLLLDIILSGNYRGRVSSGRSTGWMSSRGGFSGPFRGSGGFGGGRSGGGGASRKF
jgi:uncharacterized protein